MTNQELLQQRIAAARVRRSECIDLAREATPNMVPVYIHLAKLWSNRIKAMKRAAQ